jgi:hypothetical protein
MKDVPAWLELLSWSDIVEAMVEVAYSRHDLSVHELRYERFDVCYNARWTKAERNKGGTQVAMALEGGSSWKLGVNCTLEGGGDAERTAKALAD